MDCLFCKIINGDIPSYKLYEDDKVIVILDAFPMKDGHILIIPKKHFEDFYSLDNDTLIHINKISKMYTDILVDRMNINSLSVRVNYLDAQEIKHYHMHLIPNLNSSVKMELSEVYNLLKKED